jgi:hypothetical protein
MQPGGRSAQEDRELQAALQVSQAPFSSFPGPAGELQALAFLQQLQVIQVSLLSSFFFRALAGDLHASPAVQQQQGAQLATLYSLN